MKRLLLRAALGLAPAASWACDAGGLDPSLEVVDASTGSTGSSSGFVAAMPWVVTDASAPVLYNPLADADCPNAPALDAAFDASDCPAALPAPESTCASPNLVCPYAGDAGYDYLVQCVFMPDIPCATAIWQPMSFLEFNDCHGTSDAGTSLLEAGIPCEDRALSPCTLSSATNSPQEQLNENLTGTLTGCGLLDFLEVEVEYQSGCPIYVTPPGAAPCVVSQLTNQRSGCAVGLACAQGHGIIPLVSDIEVRRDF